MKFVIQRVNWASVACFDDKLDIIHNDNIQKGLLIFVGINKNDIKNEDKINKAINKILNLPLFDNEEGKIKLSLNDIN
jgi:D-Tyr-tRNAtyr deacylase